MPRNEQRTETALAGLVGSKTYVFIIYICCNRSTFLFAFEVLDSSAIAVIVAWEPPITGPLRAFHIFPEKIRLDTQHPRHANRCNQ
jgi:hypothetical protein